MVTGCVGEHRARRPVAHRLMTAEYATVQILEGMPGGGSALISYLSCPN